MVWIPLLKYFQLKTTHKQPLPDPNGELSLKISLSGISSANACIGKLLPQFSDTCSRGPYANLSPAQKFEIGKQAVEIETTHSNAIIHHPF